MMVGGTSGMCLLASATAQFQARAILLTRRERSFAHAKKLGSERSTSVAVSRKAEAALESQTVPGTNRGLPRIPQRSIHSLRRAVGPARCSGLRSQKQTATQSGDGQST